jgi:hypothetical protein
VHVSLYKAFVGGVNNNEDHFYFTIGISGSHIQRPVKLVTVTDSYDRCNSFSHPHSSFLIVSEALFIVIHGGILKFLTTGYFSV